MIAESLVLCAKDKHALPFGWRLPIVPGITYQLRTSVELQAEADRTGTPVPYLRVGFVEIVDACAAIEVEWTDAYPAAGPPSFDICRCNGMDRYRRAAGRWVLE